MVVPWILSFERADESSRLYDSSHVPIFQTFQRHFRGWRIVSLDPPEIEVYSDQIFPDAETIVAARTPQLMPWHTLALGMRAERSGELAFSSNKADRMRVDWLSLVAGPSLPILERHLRAAREQEHLPYAQVLREYVSADEVAARYEAMARWYAARRHFWIDSGPYYLHSVHPVERSVVLRRYEDFPDRADKWLRFAEPWIPAVDVDGPMLVRLGGRPEFDIDISFNGEPYPADAVERVRYLLFDDRNRLIDEGDAEPEGEGRWRVVLDTAVVDRLGVGASSIEVAVTSTLVALPAFASHAFAVVPDRQAAGARHADARQTGARAQ
jgi:peptide/nickel transport system substrate-binding protein